MLELLEAGDAIPDLLASRLNTLGWFRFWQSRAERMRTLVRTALYLIFSMTDHWVRTGLEETPESMAVFCSAFLHRPLLGN